MHGSDLLIIGVFIKIAMLFVSLICGIAKIIFLVLNKTKLIYPVAYFIIISIICAYGSGFIYRILQYKVFNFINIADIGLISTCILSIILIVIAIKNKVQEIF